MPREECARKLALLEDVQAAMGALMAIHNDEVSALLSEDFDRITELRTKLQAAREHKANLIELYREHVTSTRLLSGLQQLVVRVFWHQGGLHIEPQNEDETKILVNVLGDA